MNPPAAPAACLRPMHWLHITSLCHIIWSEKTFAHLSAKWGRKIFSRIMGIGVGISFDKDSARFVALRLRGRKGTVINHAEQPLSPEDLTFGNTSESGDELRKHLTGNVAASLPPSDCTTRLLSLPFKRTELRSYNFAQKEIL